MNETGLHCHAAFFSVLGKLLIWIELGCSLDKGDLQSPEKTQGRRAKPVLVKLRVWIWEPLCLPPSTQFILFCCHTTELKAEKVA